MSDTEGSQCEGCRWTRNEMAKIRAKLDKAEKVISIVERLLDPRCEDFHHVKGDRHHGDKCSIVTGYEEALKEYRGEGTK